MGEVKGRRVDIIDNLSLSQSVTWAEGFLNDLGGDFSLITIEQNKAILMNHCACPGYHKKNQACNQSCDDIEKAVHKAVKFFDPQLSAGFAKCSCDESAACELVIRLS